MSTRTTAAARDGIASPAAVRLRRPGWRDPRLLLGIALVGGSVALGSWAVASAGRTVPVLVARDVLLPGRPLTQDDVVVQQVRLPATSAYLPADQPLPELVVLRTVGAGELVPAAAVTAPTTLDVRPVAVTPSGVLSTDVRPGAVVDLWYVPEPSDGGSPGLLVERVTVAEVRESGSHLSVGAAGAVQVLVPSSALAAVLGAEAADGSVQVVPVAGGGEG